MNTTKKRARLLAVFLASLMLLISILAVLPASAEEASELTIENGVATNIAWNNGFVGSSVNAYGYVNKINASASGYIYSDIITVPKAGTTLSWSETVQSQMVSINAYVVSSWKEESGTWVIDTEGANYAGYSTNSSRSYRQGVIFWNLTTQTATYSYTTTRDNEQLRLGARCSSTDPVYPTVYAGNSATNASGTISNTVWYPGYIGAASNSTAVARNAQYDAGTYYTYSAPILLQTAGTTLSFSVTSGENGISNFASSAAYVFSVWHPETDGTFSFGYGMAGQVGAITAWQTIDGDTYTYTYTSSYDNEYIRICYRSEAAQYTLPDTTPALTITENSGGTPTLSTAYYDPANHDFVRSVTWSNGYIGSSANTSCTNKINTSDTNYKYSSIFPVWGKGTLVMFTDRGTPFPSNNAYAIASFTDEDNSLLDVDTTGANIAGGDTTHYVTNPDGSRTYYYYTTEDVEYLRVCLQSQGGNLTDNSNYRTFIPPAVYTISSATLNTSPSSSYTGNFLPELVSTLGDHADLFAGKEMVILGDSYFAGNGIDKNDVWPAMFADLYDMTFYNHGINGSTISDYVTTNNPMVNRISAMEGGENTALVLFEGGRNDYNQATPIGTLGDTNSKTFYGALYTAITQLLEKYPNALIICLNPWDLTGQSANNPNKAGHSSNDYANAFKTYVESLDNDRVVMLNSNSTAVVPVFLKQASFRLLFGQHSGDISHMNSKGMKYILPFFEELLADFMTRYTAIQNAGGGIKFEENGVTYRLLGSDVAGTRDILEPMVSTGDFVGWSGTVNGKNVFYPADGTITVAEGDVGTLTPCALNINASGSTVRLTPGSTGIRFLTEIDLAQYNTIASAEGVTVTCGTLVVPLRYMAKLRELTFENLDKENTQHLNIVAKNWYATTETTGILAGSIANIFEDHYTLDFVGRGYVKVEFADGTSKVFYAANSITKYTSIYDLADSALKDVSETESETHCYPLEDNSGFSRYTAAERQVLKGFMPNILVVIENTATASGFEVIDTDIAYTLSYDENTELLTITRTDGVAITDATFGGVRFCGAFTTYTITAEGALQIRHSIYTDNY